jgi:hypothetical protein
VERGDRRRGPTVLRPNATGGRRQELHEPPRAGRGDRVGLEEAFLADQRGDEERVDALRAGGRLDDLPVAERVDRLGRRGGERAVLADRRAGAAPIAPIARYASITARRSASLASASTSRRAKRGGRARRGPRARRAPARSVGNACGAGGITAAVAGWRPRRSSASPA